MSRRRGHQARRGAAALAATALLAGLFEQAVRAIRRQLGLPPPETS
jgi:hypothetical protein